MCGLWSWGNTFGRSLISRLTLASPVLRIVLMFVLFAACKNEIYLVLSKLAEFVLQFATLLGWWGDTLSALHRDIIRRPVRRSFLGTEWRYFRNENCRETFTLRIGSSLLPWASTSRS
jgi:hypothetical protein